MRLAYGREKRNNAAEGRIYFEPSSVNFGTYDSGYKVNTTFDQQGDNVVQPIELKVKYESAQGSLDDRPSMLTFSAVSDKFVFDNYRGPGSDELVDMGEYYGPIQIYPVEGLSSGTHIATVTVLGDGVSTIEAEVRFIVTGFVDVEFIVADVPDQMTTDQTITLSGSVLPDDATNSTITWRVTDGKSTGAVISGNRLTAARAGLVKIMASVANGASGGNKDFEREFIINVLDPGASFVPVIDITDVPIQMNAGDVLTLTGTVKPSKATRREIVWSVAEDGGTGAAISGGNQLRALTSGMIKVRAQILAGTETGPFIKDFNILVNQAEEKEVCSKGVKAKGVADYKVAVSSLAPTGEEINRLIGPGFKHIGSYQVTGRITGTAATLSFPVQGASDNMTPHVLMKGANGWELLPAHYEAPNRITCIVTELSTFAVFADSGKAPTTGNGSSAGGSSGGGGGGGQYGGIKTAGGIGMIGIIPSSEGRGVWEKAGETDWKFNKEEGGYAKGEWLRIDGIWYCFGTDSLMLTGWQYINNIWYYLMPDGSMVKGWFLDPQSQKYFYFAEGAMVTGWRQIDGKYYYFNLPSDGIEGAMATDTRISDGYYVGTDGARVTE